MNNTNPAEPTVVITLGPTSVTVVAFDGRDTYVRRLQTQPGRDPRVFYAVEGQQPYFQGKDDAEHVQLRQWLDRLDQCAVETATLLQGLCVPSSCSKTTPPPDAPCGPSSGSVAGP